MLGLRRLLSRRKKPAFVTPLLPEGERIYCIGDIHGRADLLQSLHRKIQLDAESYTGRKWLVYLGDYIDRGQDSNLVIETLAQEPIQGFDIVHLRGNHEQSMLDFLTNADVGRAWFNYGGQLTLVSYGVCFAKLPTAAADYVSLQQALIKALPEAHLHFLRSCRHGFMRGNYYFVHAGIRPGIALDQQQDQDLLWIRDEFIEYTGAYEKIIVHGHTISEEPVFKPNRIGVDTGAYLSGNLSCVVLQDDTQRIIDTHD